MSYPSVIHHRHHYHHQNSTSTSTSSLPFNPFSSLHSKDTAAAGSYVGVITVTSFFLWYRPIYLGYKKEGGLALFFCECDGVSRVSRVRGFCLPFEVERLDAGDPKTGSRIESEYGKADPDLDGATCSVLRSLLLLWRVALVVLALVSVGGFGRSGIEAQHVNFYFFFRSMLIGIPCTFLSYRLDPKSPQTAKLYHHYYPTATGSAGLINTISMFSQTHIVAGVFGIISSVGWAVQVLFGGWLYKSVWDFKNNNEGISFQNVSRGGVGLRRRPGSWLDGRANFV